MDKKVQVVIAEEIRPEAKFFTMREGCLMFKVDRRRLDTLKKRLQTAQKNRNPKQTVEKTSKEIIINGLKFLKGPALNDLKVYLAEQPSIAAIVESMTEQLFGELKFKPEADGQTKLKPNDINEVVNNIKKYRGADEKRQGRHQKVGQ